MELKRLLDERVTENRPPSYPPRTSTHKIISFELWEMFLHADVIIKVLWMLSNKTLQHFFHKRYRWVTLAHRQLVARQHDDVIISGAGVLIAQEDLVCVTVRFH